MLISISDITVSAGRREAVPEDIRVLADSIAEVGLITPITIDCSNTLIAGLHRLEAVKLLGWTEIECTIRNLEGLQAELAEIDENLIRHKLHYMDEGKRLARRKEIYETLHPETKQGGDRKSGEIKTKPFRFDSAKPFSADASEKLGVTRRSVEQKIQVATGLTPRTQEIVQEKGIGFKDALKLSRLAPEQQEEAANRLVEHKDRSKDRPSPLTEGSENEAVIAELPSGASLVSRTVPYSLGTKHFATLEESIADLKDPNKDCRYTLDTLLADIDGFVDRFHRDFEWYNMAVCTDLFPQLSEVQIEFVQERFDTISEAMQKLLHKMKEIKT